MRIVTWLIIFCELRFMKWYYIRWVKVSKINLSITHLFLYDWLNKIWIALFNIHDYQVFNDKVIVPKAYSNRNIISTIITLRYQAFQIKDIFTFLICLSSLMGLTLTATVGAPSPLFSLSIKQYVKKFMCTKL